MRPFDFMVAFWGKRHRDYFVDLCLPSLLAPHNLPLLRAEHGHQFLIATTLEDWNAIKHLAVMERLRRHASPIFIEVKHPRTDRQLENYAQYEITVQHFNHCLKMLFQLAYMRRGYGSLVIADHIFSDYMIARLIKLAGARYELVCIPVMRQIEEDVLNDLVRSGYLQVGKRLSLTGEALIIPQRKMADLACRHLHPELLPYDQGKPVQPPFSLRFMYWRIGDGLLWHSFFASQVCSLIDFEVVPEDHADFLNQGTEDLYTSRNFAASNRIYLVQDSDDFIAIALTPKAVNWAPALESQRVSRLRRLTKIRESMRFYAGEKRDVFKRDMFRLPIRWHPHELDDLWQREETRIERLINQAVGDYYAVGKAQHRERFPTRPTFLDLLMNLRAAKDSFAVRFAYEFGRRLMLLLRGNAAAKAWLIWRVQVLGRQMRGYTNHPPRPDVP